MGSNKTNRTVPKKHDPEMVRRYEASKAKFEAEVKEFKKSMVPTPALQAALALDAYISDRAKAEGVGYDLSVAWFWLGFESNTRNFFGVLVGDDGVPVEDSQEPTRGYFDMWMEKAWE